MSRVVGLGQPTVLTPTQRLMAALERGATTARAAQLAGVSEAQAEMFVDHMRRAGILQVAGQGGGCDHGLCCGEGADDPNTVLHCAGCPMIA
ncbi:MAG: hypothetical protein E7A62_09250 [Actinomycetaceae bacterium]|nr:hypothetical protein [Actinomycetaceae bacterium]MDU0971157.1 hypothetical protein [Actinomycetaceae bacterium]